MVDPAGESLRVVCDGVLDSRLFGAARAQFLVHAALEEVAAKLSAQPDAAISFGVAT
jgi:hypothetical protein